MAELIFAPLVNFASTLQHFRASHWANLSRPENPIPSFPVPDPRYHCTQLEGRSVNEMWGHSKGNTEVLTILRKIGFKYRKYSAPTISELVVRAKDKVVRETMDPSL